MEETLTQALQDQEDEINSNTNLYKNIALTSRYASRHSVNLTYFLFALASSPISVEELANYNWVLKHSIIN